MRVIDKCPTAVVVTHRVIVGIAALLERRDDSGLVKRTLVVDINLPLGGCKFVESQPRRETWDSLEAVDQVEDVLLLEVRVLFAQLEGLHGG